LNGPSRHIANIAVALDILKSGKTTGMHRWVSMIQPSIEPRFRMHAILACAKLGSGNGHLRGRPDLDQIPAQPPQTGKAPVTTFAKT